MSEENSRNWNERWWFLWQKWPLWKLARVCVFEIQSERRTKIAHFVSENDSSMRVCVCVYMLLLLISQCEVAGYEFSLVKPNKLATISAKFRKCLQFIVWVFFYKVKLGWKSLNRLVDVQQQNVGERWQNWKVTVKLLKYRISRSVCYTVRLFNPQRCQY